MSYDLSILIPARNEMFLSRTVEDILANIEGNTEIIVVLDGEWADPVLPDHERVKILYNPKSVGQRAATNQAARLSDAKYVMKVDAHCAFDKGFDVKMMAEMHDDWTMVPTMRNLHAFNWVCPDGHARYQSPSGPCRQCGKPTTRDVVWIAKPSPQSTAFRFDKDLHFQYWGELKRRQHGDVVESLSIQGSCFMLTREKYWELNICDEAHGSWGQQGVEVACKTWLSGGKIMINTKTWYAHLFRTQGGDFGFPYPNPGVEKARQYSKELWLNDRWPKAKYKLQWLIDRFSPVPEWEASTNKGIIFYTDNKLPLRIARPVQKQIKSIGLPIVSASLKPMEHMGRNVHVKLERGPLTMFKQILAALEASTAEIIFFCEHDVLYHPSHFNFTPPNNKKFYYNHNWWKVRPDGFMVHWDANQVSGLCGYRDHLLNYFKERVSQIERDGFNGSYEPGGHDPNLYESWNAEFPMIDIRHGGNLTKGKWSIADFRDKKKCINWKESTIDHIEGWDKEMVASLLLEK